MEEQQIPTSLTSFPISSDISERFVRSSFSHCTPVISRSDSGKFSPWKWIGKGHLHDIAWDCDGIKRVFRPIDEKIPKIVPDGGVFTKSLKTQKISINGGHFTLRPHLKVVLRKVNAPDEGQNSGICHYLDISLCTFINGK